MTQNAKNETVVKLRTARRMWFSGAEAKEKGTSGKRHSQEQIIYALQMKLQMKREGLAKMNRRANGMPLDSGTATIP